MSLAEDWQQWLIVGPFVVVALGTAYNFVQQPLYISFDSALFQHTGWYVTEGALPYVDVWDIKPPLIYGVTAVLALLSFGNMTVLHLLSIVTTVVVVSSGITLVGVLTHRLTGDGGASLVAATTMLTIPTLYMYPFAGIRPKYFAFCCGVGALVLAVDERPTWAGGMAAAAAGFWQLGLPVAGVVVAAVGYRQGRRAAAWAVAGGLVVAVLTVAPFVLTGNGVALYLQSVVAPMYGVSRYTFVGTLYELVVEMGYGLGVVPIGLYGLVVGVQRDRRYWWLLLGAGVYMISIFVEMGGAIDMVLLYPFVAVGVGLCVARLSSASRRRLAGVVVLLTVGSLAWSAGPVTPVKDAVQASYDQSNIYADIPERFESVPQTTTIYWEQRQPDVCNYHSSKKQIHFESQTTGYRPRTDCTKWPFDRPPLGWTLDTLWPFG